MPDLTATIARLRSLLAEATPGPWAMEPSPPRLFRVVSGLDRLGSVVSSAMWSGTDACLIAEGRNALPALLDEVEAVDADAARLRTERDALAAALAPDVAMRVHLRHCAACAGPNDGCELGQELEERCRRGGWDAPTLPPVRRWCPECQREVMPEDVGKPACPGCGVA